MRVNNVTKYQIKHRYWSKKMSENNQNEMYEDCEYCQGTGDKMEGDVVVGVCQVCGGSGVNEI